MAVIKYALRKFSVMTSTTILTEISILWPKVNYLESFRCWIPSVFHSLTMCIWQLTDSATETSLQLQQSSGWNPSPSHVSSTHPCNGFTWMTFTFVSLYLLLSSTCSVSSLVIIKMTEEELKVTFFFGLSPAFWDITIGRMGLSLPVAGGSFIVLWNLIRRKHRSCKRQRRNCKRE